MKRTASLLSLSFVAASLACGSKGPPPRVAEVPIDDGTPRVATPASAPPVGAGRTASAGGTDALAGLIGDPAAAFGMGGGAGGGGAGASAGGGGGAAVEGLPVQLPAMRPAVPTMTEIPSAGGAGGAAGAATAAAKPLPPKGERLSAAECNKIMDKYIELVGISQGISPDAISGVMTMLRNSVANDPNYANALGACAKENTKTQYRCAMKASDVDGWKKCLQ